MFNKKAKPYTELLGKQIEMRTIIKGDIVSQADFRLDGIDWKLFSTGKLVIGPAGIITGDIQCKMQISKNLKELLELLKYLT
jgi:cytoskeletal protein CcmA (bactofilin family)